MPGSVSLEGTFKSPMGDLGAGYHPRPKGLLEGRIIWEELGHLIPSKRGEYAGIRVPLQGWRGSDSEVRTLTLL